LFCQSTDFIGAQKFLNSVFPDKTEATIFIEIPNTFLYDRNENLTDSVRDNALIKMGGNRREAMLLSMMLAEIGFDDVREVPPVRKKKWTQAQFELYTGSKRRTNEHIRDAARLAIFNAD